MRILRPFVLSRVLREREFMPDIVHCFVEPYAPFAAKLSRQSGAPFVLTAHGTYAVRSLADVSFGPLQKRAYRAASMIVCISAYTQKRLRMFEPDLPTTVIPNGVRIPTLDSGHNPQEPLLLSVGALKERKGYRYVLEALPQIAQATPSVTYVVVGDQRDSAYARSLREIVERLGLQQRVTFKEGISDAELGDLYRRARVFVLTPVSAPLNFEGFGLVYLEANARGVPVVGSFENGGEDAIVDGRTGYLTKPCNPQDIAEKVTRLLQPPRCHICRMVSRVPFMGALAFVAPYRRSVPGSVLLSDQQSVKVLVLSDGSPLKPPNRPGGGRGEIRTHEGAQTPCRFSRPVP